MIYPYVLRTVTGTEIVARTAELLPIYRESFSEPPWSEPPGSFDTFGVRLARQMANAGSGGILAETGGQIAGAVYGWSAPDRMPTGTPFDVALLAAAPPGVVDRLIAPGLIVVELMVATAHRRQGLAAKLLDAYAGDAPQAWLCTHPDAPAGQLYARQGWHEAFAFTVADNPRAVYVWP